MFTKHIEGNGRKGNCVVSAGANVRGYVSKPELYGDWIIFIGHCRVT